MSVLDPERMRSSLGQRVGDRFLKYTHEPSGDEAQTLVGRIDVGLHLNLSEAFHPGGSLPWRTLVLRAVLRQLDGGWARAQTAHFNDGGLFDQIFEDAKK